MESPRLCNLISNLSPIESHPMGSHPMEQVLPPVCNISIKELIMPLTVDQHKHLEGVKWLLSPTLATGKTHLICYAALEVAAENPGKPVHLFDHCIYQSDIQRKRLITQVQQQFDISKYKDKYKLIIKNTTISLQGI